MEIEVSKSTTIEVRHAYGNVMKVEIDCSVRDVIDSVGIDVLLDEIGQDNCVSYFGLELKDE